MNQENSEIFSPDDLNQFHFSPSDKRIYTQPLKISEPTVPKASTVPKLSKKRGPRSPYKKKPKQ